MEYSFSAELCAGVVIPDKDFEMLLEVAAHHYDNTVQASVCVGGFLYGFKNRRDFSNGEDKTVWLTQRQLGLVLKSLEMQRTDQARNLGSALFVVLKALQGKMEAINCSFEKLHT